VADGRSGRLLALLPAAAERLRRLLPALHERLRRLLPALWAGALLAVALLAAPGPFAVLSRADAGRVNARLFEHEAWLSVVLAVLLWVLERPRARRASRVDGGSAFTAELVLILLALFCTIAGHFALQPMLAAARAGQGGWSFAQLHGASVAFYAVKTLAVAALAWRATARR